MSQPQACNISDRIPQIELELFFKSSVYSVLQEVAEARMNQIMAELSSKQYTEDLGEVRFRQGELNGVEFWKNFLVQVALVRKEKEPNA